MSDQKETKEVKLIYTGGPAFPTDDNPRMFRGLTKREWFAGQALIGVISAEKADRVLKRPDFVADLTYKIADAMLKRDNTSE